MNAREKLKKIDIALAQLRHMHFQLVAGLVRDHEQLAKGLLSPVISDLEEIQREIATEIHGK